MLTTILLFILLLSLLVLIHELGHFVAARRSGIAVEEFGFGFPPRIAGIRRKGTLYSINWLPLGGFVRIKGVADDEENDGRMDDADSFAAQSYAKRFIVLFAGIAMNFILAAILFVAGYTIGLPSVIDEQTPDSAIVSHPIVQVVSVLPDSAADKMGIVAGDEIITIDGRAFDTVEEIQDFNAARAGQTVTLRYIHDDKPAQIDITLMELPDGRGGMGVGLLQTATVSYPFPESIYRGTALAIDVTGQIFAALADIAKNLFAGHGAGDSISGPVGIAVLTGRVAELGLVYVLQFAAILSLNLAIFNLLPIPALDGGRIFFLLIERIRGKQLTQAFEGRMHKIGFLALMFVFILVTIRDIRTYSDSFANFFQHLF